MNNIDAHKQTSLFRSISKGNEQNSIECWYDSEKPEYRQKAKWWSLDADSFIAYIKTGDIYIDIEKKKKNGARFDTSNYETDKPLSRGKIKK